MKTLSMPLAVDPTVSPFKCAYCSNGYDRLKGLVRHCARTHGQSLTAFQCGLCTCVCSTPTGLRLHLNAIHADFQFAGRPLVCGVCEAAYHQPSDLWRHIKSMHLQLSRKEVCFICSCVLPEVELKAHISAAHPTILCHLCDYRGQTLLAYTHHLTCSHFPEGISYPGTVAACGLCGRTFASGAQLYTHMLHVHLRHISANLEVCEFCSEAVARSDLPSHKQRQHAKIPCLRCQKVCSWENFSRHGERNHS